MYKPVDYILNGTLNTVNSKRKYAVRFVQSDVCVLYVSPTKQLDNKHLESLKHFSIKAHSPHEVK